ncbi:transposase [candidate division KSB1 bacterium]
MPKPGSLSTIIRSFKSAVTKNCRKNGFNDFVWQQRFYEHIIRSEKSLEKIRYYIKTNPVEWKMDEYFII